MAGSDSVGIERHARGATVRIAPDSKRQSEEHGTGNRVVVVARDRTEPQGFIERDRLLERGLRIQVHLAVSDRSSGLDDRDGEAPAQTEPMMRAGNVHALHLAPTLLIEGAEGHTPDG